MTDTEWQDYFARMKMIIEPVKVDTMNLTAPLRLRSGETYHGETQARRYQNFINDILATIRLGEPDFCFYIYQIADLLKYEPNLKAQWLSYSKCFMLSL